MSVVIKEAKKLNYADKINQSSNKNKTIWNIIKSETNRSGISDKINTLNVEGNLIKNRQEIVNTFNNYFSSIAKNINSTHINLSNYKHMILLPSIIYSSLLRPHSQILT